MSKTVSAHDYADLLSMVPAMLGFTPEDSVVIVPFDGNTSAGVMRMDLPDPDVAMEFVSQASHIAARIPNASGAVVVIYSPLDHGLVEYAADAAKAVVELTSMELLDNLYVCGDGYGRWSSHEAPRPTSELALPLEVAHFEVTGNQQSSATIPDSDPAVLMSMLKIEPHEALDPNTFNATAEDSLYNWEPIDLTGEQAAWLVATFNSPLYRDTYLSQVASNLADGESMLTYQLGYREHGVFEGQANVMIGKAPRPDGYRLERALEFARYTAAIIPLPGAFAVAAWLSWALGRSTHAEVYAQMAQKLDPQHGLAGIVQDMVTASYLPEWAFESKEN